MQRNICRKFSAKCTLPCRFNRTKSWRWETENISFDYQRIEIFQKCELFHLIDQLNACWFLLIYQLRLKTRLKDYYFWYGYLFHGSRYAVLVILHNYFPHNHGLFMMNLSGYYRIWIWIYIILLLLFLAKRSRTFE